MAIQYGNLSTHSAGARPTEPPLKTSCGALFICNQTPLSSAKMEGKGGFTQNGFSSDFAFHAYSYDF